MMTQARVICTMILSHSASALATSTWSVAKRLGGVHSLVKVRHGRVLRSRHVISMMSLEQRRSSEDPSPPRTFSSQLGDRLRRMLTRPSVPVIAVRRTTRSLCRAGSGVRQATRTPLGSRRVDAVVMPSKSSSLDQVVQRRADAGQRPGPVWRLHRSASLRSWPILPGWPAPHGAFATWYWFVASVWLNDSPSRPGRGLEFAESGLAR